jgi:Tol biopolymer transport system component
MGPASGGAPSRCASFATISIARVRLTRSILIAAVTALSAPALAHATLVYQKGVNTTAIYAANDDGSGAKKLVSGALPHVSPDGNTVTYISNIDGENPVLRAIPAAGGQSRVLLKPWRYGVFAWSPDSRYIAAQSGSLNGKQKLVLIDLVAGTSRTVATGFFSGASFSPDSTQLIYSLVASDRQVFPRSNLVIAPVAGGAPKKLTSNDHSLYPLWGPKQIVYVRYKHPTGKHRHEDGPKYNLWLMNPDGSGDHQLTHDRVPFLLTGLVPTDWSDDGTRLLAQFGGQDTTYAVTVNPASGRERIVGRASQSIVGTALSHDGSTILGYTGGAFEDPKLQNTITAPYDGGTPKLLVRRAYFADWTH